MYEALQGILFRCPPNVDFSLYVLKEGFLLPMECYGVIGRIFRTLKEWIYMDAIPVFMRDPPTGRIPGKDCVEAGSQAVLQTSINILCWFYFSPYLVEEKRSIAFQISHKILGLLKDLASPQRVPYVYLSSETWVVLLRCLLRVVDHTLMSTPPSGDAYHFAKGVVTSLFQTLLITWVLAAAVCRVSIPAELWSDLVRILSERTSWPELIDEWNKVLESVTRALSLNFYQIDLQNPPLERLSEQKLKRQIGASKANLPPNQAGAGDSGVGNHSMSRETYDFCQTASPVSSITSASMKSEDKVGSDAESSLVRNVVSSEGSDSPMINQHGRGSLSESKKSSDSLTPDDSQVNSDTGSCGIPGNPEVVSLGSVSMDSNSLGLLASEKDAVDGAKNGAVFGDRDSMTPSPVQDPGAEGIEDFDPVEDGGDMELTPRGDGIQGESDGSEDVWMVVWRRMLGSIGNINDIRDPAIHAKAIRAVSGVVEMLVKINANQGVSLDGQPPVWPPLTPPFPSLSPWLIGSFQLPDTFQKSKLSSLETLCRIIFTRNDSLVGEDLAAQFCDCVHKVGALNTDEASRAIVRSVCPYILYQDMPGWQVLIGDCLDACLKVVRSRMNITETVQAINFLAGLVCFPVEMDDCWMRIDREWRSGEVKVEEMGAECLRILVETVGGGKGNHKALTTAINSLSVLVCNRKVADQLSQQSLNSLLQLMMERNSMALQICDNLSVLLDPSSYSASEYKDTILAVLKCYCIVLEKSYSDKNYEEFSQRILTDVTEWCLRVPKSFLLQESSGSDHQNLMHSILRVMNLCLQDEGALFPCASVCQKLLTRFWLQYPLPQFGAAHLGSEETEMDAEPDSFPRENSVVAYSDDMIWSVSPAREEGCKLLTRSTTGKHCWEVREQNPSDDSPATRGTVVNRWLENIGAELRDSSEVKDEGKTAEEEEESGFLGSLCSSLALSSPEAVPHSNFPNPSDEPTIKQESEVLASFHQLSLNSSSAERGSETRESGGMERKRSGMDEWRWLLGDLSMITWNKNAKFNILRKDSGRLQRELKHIDKIICRETHKVAVIFVAEGQEDKQSILSNSAGSHLFEEFVSRLGWEIELASHTGYAGGLPSEGSTPYYASPSSEVIFHVSTRMPFSDQTKKLRHLGNDEVHIVWSEHWRDYRRSIIATEFCDVLIVIYPLHNKLFRLHMECREGELSFGPLFSGAVVSWAHLAPLIRATALNASRAKRRRVQGWKHWSDQRAGAIRTIRKQLSKPLPFSPLTTRLYSEGKTEDSVKQKLIKASPITESSDVVMV